jgi:hypothetical protein
VDCGADATRAAVGRAFRSSIDTENLDVLKILVHLWPAWRALRLGTEATEYSPFYYAVAMHKEKAADLLLDPKISQGEDPKLWRSYELARTAALPDVMRYILRHNQDKLSTETTETWTYNVLKCQLDDKEVRKLLQTLEINIRETLFGTVVAAWRAIIESIPLNRPEIWYHLAVETSKLDLVVLDSLVLYLRAPEARDEFDGLDDDEYDQVVATLIQNGALDRKDAMTISMAGELGKLETLVKEGSDSVSIRRMLNVQDMQSRSILSHVLSREKRFSHDPKHYFDIVNLLLKHGSLVTVQDVMNTNAIRYKDSSLVVQMMLLAEQKVVASDVLCQVFSRSSRVYLNPEDGVQRVHILLKSAVDPTLKNEDGKTPREKFDEISERLSTNTRTRIIDPLRRWEDYYRDPSIGNPSDQLDKDWVEVHDRVVWIAGEHRWASLVEKVPSFRVIDADTTREGVRRREIERIEIEIREIEIEGREIEIEEREIEIEEREIEIEEREIEIKKREIEERKGITLWGNPNPELHLKDH